MMAGVNWRRMNDYEAETIWRVDCFSVSDRVTGHGKAFIVPVHSSTARMRADSPSNISVVAADSVVC